MSFVGLFDYLFGKKKQASAKERSYSYTPTYSSPLTSQSHEPVDLYSLTPWEMLEKRRTVHVDGDISRRVFVYDSAPLYGVHAGDTIQLEAYCGDGKMKSRHTGTRWSTRGKGTTLVLYNGHPIGFVSIPIKETRKLAKRGIAYTLTAKCHGYLDGYPDVKDLRYKCPPLFFADDVIELADLEDAGVPKDAAMLEFNVFDEKRLTKVSSKKAWRFPNARVELIPPKEGSRAKPVARLVSEAGKAIVEFTSKNGRYAEIANLAGSGKMLFVTARRIQNRDDNPYHFTIRYW